MRQALRNFLAWLDKRFPEKVVITTVAYTALLERVTKLEAAAERYSETRVKQIESEINKFNLHMGFGGSIIPKGMEKSFQR